MVVNLTDSTGYIQWKLTNPNLSASEYSAEQVRVRPESDTGVFSTTNNGNDNGTTDGKNDGKIGFLSTVYNVGKGAVNTTIDLVKGCVMDEEGHLSPGRMLLTAGAIGTCILFPPLGVAAGALGLAAGGYQAIKGGYNLYNAKTDAEAKAAAQDIGGGALTGVASGFGLRGSYGAMKATSTAGNAGTSALDELSNNASILKKADAFLSDAWSSPKNNLTSLKDSVLEVKNVRSEVAEINKMRKANAKALEKQAKGETLTAEELKAIDAWDNFDASKYSAEAVQKASKLNEKAYFESELAAAKKAGDEAAIEAAKAELQKFSTLHNIKNSITETVSNTNTAQATNNFTNGLENVDGVLNKMDAFKKNVTKDNLKELYQGMKGDAKAILKSIVEEDPQSTISKYGYKNVAQVLKVATGVDAAV